MKLVYFAWIRERIGEAEEEIDLPSTVRTVADLLDHLAARSEGHAMALENRSVIRVAIDHEHALAEDPIGHASEVALFPPMTGG